MSRHLFGQAYAHLPLGIIVKKYLDESLHRPSLDRVGLMNICNLPMQKSAYGSHPFSLVEKQFLTILEGLRAADQSRTYRDQAWTPVQDILLDALRSGLAALWDRRLLIVPCGRFAQKFFALADTLSPNWQVVSNIPHPSYNNWSKPAYAQAMHHLLSAFQSEKEAT